MKTTASEQLRALAREATDGPWEAHAEWGSHLSNWAIMSGEQLVAKTPRIPERSDNEIPDGQLIALAPQLAELVADMGEALILLANLDGVVRAGDPSFIRVTPREICDPLLARLNALFTKENA